ncbi:MAG: glycerol-3-phosphate 1-O-acyltransferase PlsY [Candidatus Eremiobacteraeota bacterium]|nr:glycerol-3-phosphate 1-O-acyltransferase PlsY [Candidatus Eremiobacteraeota bacterium]
MSLLLATTAVVVAFFFGSIPFGYIIGRVFYGMDIRTKGSGNIGAANALRTMGKAGAIGVLLFDALKGFIPVVLCKALGAEPAVIAVVAAAAVLGHCFSPWLGWHGGKGVATSIGAIIGLSWPAGLVCIGGWVAGAAITAFSSVGSIVLNLAAPIALWYLTREPAYAAYGAFAALLIIYTHRENIARIRAGHENAIGLFRPWRRPNEGN